MPFKYTSFGIYPTLEEMHKFSSFTLMAWHYLLSLSFICVVVFKGQNEDTLTRGVG